KVYHQANETVWSRVRIKSEAGRFAAQLTVPAAARGSCYVRAFATHANGFSLGAHRIFVRTGNRAGGQ
ncbi:MAG: hypothetical protein QF805_22445, partial [Pirellulaceae bacterium]|nr:hypothetical protein [Pirellulaceae bacterium]